MLGCSVRATIWSNDDRMFFLFGIAPMSAMLCYYLALVCGRPEILILLLEDLTSKTECNEP